MEFRWNSTHFKSRIFMWVFRLELSSLCLDFPQSWSESCGK